MTISSGTRLGPYEIVAPIGAGGMGEVFRAKDTRLDRSVAIKVLPSHLGSDPRFRERFDREARAVSALNHPHICTLHDVGHHDGIDYIVMELLEGETLADRLTKGPLPLEQVLRYGAQIADGLDKAHRQGIVHRDLKPGNVMITKSGVKLLDFGLAKTLSAVNAVSGLTNQATEHKPLTQEGTILGTFQYMAPEQLEGEEADPRTDIFALGAVLYEMATGRRAFQGKTRTSLIAAIVGGEPRALRELQPLTPPALEHVIAKCLEKEPDSRWQSAHDVAEELKWIASGTSGLVVPGRRGKVWGTAIAGLCLLAGLAAGAVMASYLRRAKPQALVSASIVPPKGVEIEVPSGSGEAVVVSPDGRALVFTGKDDAGKRQIFLRALSSRDARPLAGTDGGRYPFWSHDSRWVAFFASGKLKKIALDGSPALTICDVASNPLSGDWNAQDIILFSPASGAPLHQVAASGGKSVAITKLDEAAGETTHRWARFLPDGKSFLYMAGSHDAAENSEVNAVYASRLGSSERKLILRTRFNIDYAGGNLLFVRGETLFAQSFDPSRLELKGEPLPLVRQVHSRPEAFLAAYSVSAEDILIYVAGSEKRKRELVWLDLTGKELGKVIPPGDYGPWQLSPDGKTVALTLNDPSVNSDIWLQDLARSELVRLTLGGMDGGPVWSPDGKQIMFAGVDRDFYVKQIAGDAKAEILWPSDIWAAPVSWSPDGSHIAFWTFDPKTSTVFDVWVLPLNGERKPIPIANTSAHEFPLSFSPDGHWFLYISNAPGQNELYAVSFPDLQRRQQISVRGADFAIWKSSREIWYQRGDSTWVSVQFEERNGTIEISAPRPLFRDEKLTGLAAPTGGDRLLAMRWVGEVEPPETVLVSNWKHLLDGRPGG